MSDFAAFAKDWEAAWNSHDLDRIMSHYAEDVTFRSRKAVALTGSGTLRGKTDLRWYWSKALKRQPNLRFHVLEVFHGHDTLVIVYENQSGVRAAETLRFSASGSVVEGSACHRMT